MTFLVLPDPPVPPDGSCVVCGRPRMTWRSRKYAGFAAEQDPFDSTNCARLFHGCELAKLPSGPTAKQAA